MEAIRTTSDLSALAWKHYLWIVLTVPLVFMTVIFGLLRIPFESDFGWSFWDTAVNYPYTLLNRDADVVIFGDSSAMFGIDAKRLSVILGKKVVVLPNSLGSMPIMRDDPLQFYLHHNRRPELIVFYLGPWNLNAGNETNPSVLEGQMLLLHHAPLATILRYAGQNPMDMALVPLRSVQAASTPVDLVKYTISKLRNQANPLIQVVDGHVDYKFPKSLQDDCVFPATTISASRTEFVTELRNRYTTKQTSTFLYISPIPACRGAETIAERDYSAIAAAPPKVEPVNAFADDGRFIHPLPPMVPAATSQLASALQQFLSRQNSVPAGR